MNENLRRLLQRFREYLANLSVQKRVLLTAVGALILTGTLIGVVVVNQDPYEMLYSDLQPEDGRGMAKKLSELNIPHRMGDEAKSIHVPASRVATARMELAKAGMPGQDVVGFEKFDGSTLGMSSYVQRIHYIRAIQGELTRSIQRLASVKNARVHISIPPKKTFMEEEEPPKASVVLDLKPGQAPTKVEMNGIAHLVASAVEGLKVSQVTIVDTRGNFLHRPDAAELAGASGVMLEMQRQIENDYEKRIEDMLGPVVGVGKVRAKVTAEIDQARVNTTEETYDPEKAVVRQSLKNDEVAQGTRPNPIGIPGSRSNLPGTENQNPGVPTSNMTTEKNLQNLNYAIPKKTQTTEKPSGNIKRLTVAVVVDGYYGKGSGNEATETFTPRPEAELKRMQDIVANAVGYDPERRDSITVSSLPFRTPDITPMEEVVPQGIFSNPDVTKQLFRNGIIGFIVLLFFFLVVRPFLRWATLSDATKELTLLPKTVAELEAARRDEGMLALTKAATMLEEAEPVEKREESELKKRIMNRLNQSPRKGFRIVQDWIEEDPVNFRTEPA